MKVATHKGWDYHMGFTRLGRPHYGIVPEGKEFSGGYFSPVKLCEERGLPNLFPEVVVEIVQSIQGGFYLTNPAGVISKTFKTKQEACEKLESGCLYLGC